MQDLADLIKGIGLGSMIFVLAERYLLHNRAYPLSVYLLETITTAFLLFLLRAGGPFRSERGKRVLIVGAGFGANMIIRELKRPQTGFFPVALVDDDFTKLGARLHGVPVLGKIADIPSVASRTRAQQIFVAIPSATREEMNRIVQYCTMTSLPFKTLPALSEFAKGRAVTSQLREVNLNDLLGRQPVHLDPAPVFGSISGKVVLVTGAAGSIGSELCRQVLRFRPAKLVCLDQNETGLFYLGQELAQSTHFQKVQLCVNDITDGTSMGRVIASNDVQIVFHTAAYKHVPLVESNVVEAVRNNVFGLETLLTVAEHGGVELFLMISSDKAVNPTSLMGCTKRIGELIVSSRCPSGMRSMCVRFGNVLGSQGSVVPIFQKQIAQGRVTITHPDMKRFFMTIPEAVALVLQSCTVGEQGDILVLNMGKPLKIVELAQTLVRLSGKRVNDVKIIFTGIRPGEKLEEELFYPDEVRLDSPVQSIIRARGRKLNPNILNLRLQELWKACNLDERLVREALAQVVPEYSQSQSTRMSLGATDELSSLHDLSTRLNASEKLANSTL